MLPCCPHQEPPEGTQLCAGSGPLLLSTCSAMAAVWPLGCIAMWMVGTTASDVGHEAVRLEKGERDFSVDELPFEGAVHKVQP